MPRSDSGVDIVPIVGTIAGEGCHRPLHLVEHAANLQAINGILGGQLRCDDPPGVGIDAEMKLAPSAPRPRAVLLREPLVRPAELQACAVHQQVHGLTPAAWTRQSSVSTRRLIVLQSGTARVSPSRPMMEAMKPSVWRNARRNTARKVSAVVIAKAE
jgi:hypothetical protein